MNLVFLKLFLGFLTASGKKNSWQLLFFFRFIRSYRKWLFVNLSGYILNSPFILINWSWKMEANICISVVKKKKDKVGKEEGEFRSSGMRLLSLIHLPWHVAVLFFFYPPLSLRLLLHFLLPSPFFGGRWLTTSEAERKQESVILILLSNRLLRQKKKKGKK